MTRINIIPVEELHDQHLIAEYREITMVPAALNRTLKSKKGLDKTKISRNYTLNKGHVYFFYDKGEYLDKRYNQITQEMKRRGFQPDIKRKFPKALVGAFKRYDGDLKILNRPLKGERVWFAGEAHNEYNGFVIL